MSPESSSYQARYRPDEREWSRSDGHSHYRDPRLLTVADMVEGRGVEV